MTSTNTPAQMPPSNLAADDINHASTHPWGDPAEWDEIPDGLLAALVERLTAAGHAPDTWHSGGIHWNDPADPDAEWVLGMTSAGTWWWGLYGPEGCANPEQIARAGAHADDVEWLADQAIGGLPEPPTDETDIRITAAELIERAVDAATPGPWTASLVTSPDSTNTSAVYTLAGPPGAEVIGSAERPRSRPHDAVVAPTRRYGGIWHAPDAAYIALLDPTVGRAVAALLHDNAERHAFDPDAYLIDEATGSAHNVCTCENREPWPCPDAVSAIAIAEALLREGGERS